jgi:hypothetical protein
MRSVFDTVEKTLKADIQAVLFLVLGMSGETRSTIDETLTSIKSSLLKIQISTSRWRCLSLLHGTDLDVQPHDLCICWTIWCEVTC